MNASNASFRNIKEGRVFLKSMRTKNETDEQCILIMPSLFLAHAGSTFDDNLGFCQAILFLFSANNFAAIFASIRLGWVLYCELTASNNVFIDAEPLIFLRKFSFFLEPSDRSPVIIEGAHKKQLLALLSRVLLGKKFGEMVVWRCFYNLWT